MSKVYLYEDLSFSAAAGDEIRLTVEFISNADRGKTIVNTPGDIDPVFWDSKTVTLGTCESLSSGTTIVTTSVSNPAPVGEDITIQYSINDRPLQLHTNKKAEETRPNIILTIHFEAS